MVHRVHNGLGYPRVQGSEQVLQTHRRLSVVDSRHQPVDGLVVSGPRCVQVRCLSGQTPANHVHAQSVTRFRVLAVAPRALSHLCQRRRTLFPVSITQPRAGVLFVHQLTAVSI